MSRHLYCLAAVLIPMNASLSQTASLTAVHSDLSIDSGWCHNPGPQRSTIFRQVIAQDDAPWLRVFFQQLILGEAADGQLTVLKITSLHDGHVQRLNRDGLERWSDSSAYFNGDSLLLELIADPGAAPSRLVVSGVSAGVASQGGVATLCHEDDRSLSQDPRVGRLLPGGCTVFIIDDEQHCLLSAGHCAIPGESVVQFNVPQSLENGRLQHPPPEDQYPVDALSLQRRNTVIGDDWAYFGCFANEQTGQTMVERQGDSFELSTLTPPDRWPLAISGYGTDSTPLSHNQVQQTDQGPSTNSTLQSIRYRIDTTSGSSGSPVIDLTSGQAIGIHTNGGCTPDGGANQGTPIGNRALQEAMAAPRGVCRPTIIDFPHGVPELLDATGASIRVTIHSTKATEPITDTAVMMVDMGGGFQAVPLVHRDPEHFAAIFPPMVCGERPRFYFQVQTEQGQTIVEPVDGPETPFVSLVADAWDATWRDTFETDLGWEVDNGVDLSGGGWERGLPLGLGLRSDPPADVDLLGLGRLFATGLPAGNNDVDDGSTTLTSPILDASVGDPHIAYWVWFDNSIGADPFNDVLTVEVSDDGGAGWTLLEQLGPDGPEVGGGWLYRSFRIDEVVTANDSFRIRWIASDVGVGSVVEAAVDDVRINPSEQGYVCSTCLGDVAQPHNGQVDVQDLVTVVLSWGATGGPSDLNRDGLVNDLDLDAVLERWGACR